MERSMTVFSRKNPYFRWETDATTTRAAKLDALQAINLDNYSSKEEALKDLYVTKPNKYMVGIDYRWER